MSDIDLFFKEPSTPPSPSGVHSTLYLLRRDIKTCLGINPNTGDDMECKAIWPAAMAILAGIDLLRKFWKGDDERRKVGQRFTGFLSKFTLTADEEKLVQTRESDNYWVDILTLHKKFESAVTAYQVDLEGDSNLQRHFAVMFPKYGEVHVSDSVSILKWLENVQMEVILC